MTIFICAALYILTTEKQRKRPAEKGRKNASKISVVGRDVEWTVTNAVTTIRILILIILANPQH